MSILVFGQTGQVARELARDLRGRLDPRLRLFLEALGLDGDVDAVADVVGAAPDAHLDLLRGRGRSEHEQREADQGPRVESSTSGRARAHQSFSTGS